MDHVTVTDEGPIRIVTLNNPAKGNAISKPMGEAVQAAMREFEARDDLRSAIITAAGTRAFTFGADVSDPPELWRTIPSVGYRPLKPVICAVEGWCVGGGIVLAMMADLLVCGKSAKFYYPEAKLGLTGGMIAGLVSRIPHKIAMEIMLLCRTVDADRAASIGLVNEVVEDGKALEVAKAWALELTGMAPMVVAEHGNGTDRACRAAPDFQRKADKGEAPAANQLIQIGEAFHMRNAALGAGHMGLEIQLTFRCRADGFNAKHTNATIGQPMHGFQRKPGKIMQIARFAEQPFICCHPDQHRITLADFLP
jgi:enoyl-CoA hydratase/carnithine racemase